MSRSSIHGELLLNIQLAPLDAHSVPVDVSLPGWRSDVPDAARGGVIEDLLNLLKGFLRSLWEHEVDVPEHGETEDGEYNVDSPFDVRKCRWHEVRKGEVEDPVGGGGEGDSLATNAERVELWRVDPGDRSPGGCEGCDEEVGTRNNGLGWGTCDGHGLGGTAELTLRGRDGVACEQGGVDNEPGHHEEGTDKHSRTTTPSIDPNQSRNSHDHVDYERNRRWEQDVAAETGHGEDVGDVVHHNVHTGPESVH